MYQEGSQGLHNKDHTEFTHKLETWYSELYDLCRDIIYICTLNKCCDFLSQGSRGI